MMVGALITLLGAEGLKIYDTWRNLQKTSVKAEQHVHRVKMLT